MPSLVRLFRWSLFLVFVLLTACSIARTPDSTLVPTTPAPPTPTFTSTPTPTPTPTPTQDPSQALTDANRALFNGDWTTAEVEYQRLKDLTTESKDLASASVGLAKVFIQSNRYGEAIAELNTFLSTYADYGSAPDGYFLRGLAHQAVGEDDLAIEDFKRYLEVRPDVLVAFVEELIGDAHRRQGRSLAAIPHYERAMQAPSIESSIELRLKIGNSLLEAGEYQSAFLQYEQLFQDSVVDSTKAVLNLLMGRALEGMGDYEGAYGRYLDSVTNYPEEDEAYLALIELVNAGIPVDDFQRGVVDYHAEAYEPARDAFSRVIATTPSGSAFYFQGLVRRELGDPWTATANFQWVIDSYPDDPNWTNAWWEKAFTEWLELDDLKSATATFLGFVDSAPSSSRAPEALDRAARLLERLDVLDRAEHVWMRIAEEYPTHQLAYRGAFMSGITRFRLHDYVASRDAFLLADALSKSSEDRAAARFWTGKANFAMGEVGAAEENWRASSEADPTGYYSVRASDMLAGVEPFAREANWKFDVDWEAERLRAEQWLRDTFNLSSQGDLTSLNDTLASDARLQRGEEFWRLGLYREAKSEFESLRKSVSTNPELSYRLMHKMLELGLYQPAIFTARQILDFAGMDDYGTLSAPAFFNYIRFGTYYDDLIFPAAEEYALDKAFVLSVVRQESLFEGFITSYADARGLMQVIPSTGQGIASKLGWPPGYTDVDLYRPHISVRFGIDYLAEQRDRFDGDLLAALAAYNAGPGNSLIWRELAPNDPDLFLEIVRFDQPQRYIRSIYEFFNIYHFLYGTE